MKIIRRKFFVDKKIQFRYIAIILAPLLILLTGMYYLIYYSVFKQILIPEAIVEVLLPAMKNVNIIAAIAIPLALFFILRVALIYSNRIVGPFPRLEKELDKAISGDRSVRIKARDKDELKRFIDKVNLLLEKLDKN